MTRRTGDGPTLGARVAKQTFILPKLRARDVAICNIVDALEDLPMDQGFRVEIHEHSATRSELQNRTLWWVYGNILKLGGNTMAGWTKEDLHDHFLIEHFGHTVIAGFGRRRMKPVRRSSRLSKTEFAEFVDFIYSYMANLGVVLPLPDPDHAIEREEAEA